MIKRKLVYVLLIALISLAVSVFSISKALNTMARKGMEKTLMHTRSSLFGDVPTEKKMLVAFGNRIEHEIDYGVKPGETSVQDYLDAGCSPDFCLNLKKGWQYENPLMLFNTAALYLTYDTDIPTYPDVNVFYTLIKAGSDIKKYPYAWASVYCHDNWMIENSKERYKTGELTKDMMLKRIDGYIKDSNRVVKLFLDAGADVNKKGNSIPFDEEKCKTMNEAEVQKYFNSAESTTPLYESIKKGMAWESQVDLLLDYGATLDESCLEAAKLSGDAKMVSKIEGLLKKKK